MFLFIIILSLQISQDHDNSFIRLDTLHINDDTMGLPDFSLPVSNSGLNFEGMLPKWDQKSKRKSWNSGSCGF